MLGVPRGRVNEERGAGGLAAGGEEEAIGLRSMDSRGRLSTWA